MKTLVWMMLAGTVGAWAAEPIVWRPGRINIQHNRPDLELKELTIASFCINDQGWGTACSKASLDGKPLQHAWPHFTFPATGKNQVKTGFIRIEDLVNSKDRVCLAVKVFFKGYPNNRDSVLYQTLADRYSVLAYCRGKIPANLRNQHRVSHRNVGTISEFTQSLFSRPIQLVLKPAKASSRRR